MKFKTTVYINRLLWISSLHAEEEGPMRRILEDLQPYFESISLPFDVFVPQNAADLKSRLRQEKGLSKVGAGPVLHFDMHGSKEQGLLIAKSCEFISWIELFDELRPINVATGNNSCVVCSACFGFHLIQGLKILEASPFYALIGPDREVSAGFLEDNIRGFYKQVFAGSNIIEAFETYLSPCMRLFHSEQVLAIILVRYLSEHCIGKSGDARKERLISDVVARGAPSNRGNLRKLRASLKGLVRPTQALVDRSSNVFLIGKTGHLRIDDLMSLARNADG